MASMFSLHTPAQSAIQGTDTVPFDSAATWANPCRHPQFRLWNCIYDSWILYCAACDSFAIVKMARYSSNIPRVDNT